MLSRHAPFPLLLALALVGRTACGGGDVASSRAGALATQTPAAEGGETSPPRRICDKSARLTLGHRAEGGLPPQGDVGNLVEQAGYDLLYVDGSCHYWVRAGFGSLAWREVRTGLLGSEEESALATDLKWDSLPTRYGSRGTPDLGGGRRVLFDVGGVSECLGSCSGEDLAADREVGEAAHAWATRLYEKGTALEGAMRLRVSAALPTGQTAGEIYPLKLSVALAAVAASKDSPGSSLLVSDAGDVQSLRAMREALLGADGFRQLSVEEGGKAYQIAFRDALPFESENGAVPTPAPKLRQLRRRTWEQRRRALAATLLVDDGGACWPARRAELPQPRLGLFRPTVIDDN